MAARFFVREALARDCAGTSIDLPEDVAHHAIRVTRLGVGDALTLFDGTGGEYAASVTHIDRRTARVHVNAFIPDERESSFALTLVQAIIAVLLTLCTPRSTSRSSAIERPPANQPASPKP